MDKSDLGVTNTSKKLCHTLLGKKQTIPRDSLFRDDIFESTCRVMEDKNEAIVIRDIIRDITPLIPDYSVGFRREAFTEDRLSKLSPFIGDWISGDWISGDLSFLMATYLMYFPFLTCEVKYGAAALDTADRQNAHSMTIAARAVIELFEDVDGTVASTVEDKAREDGKPSTLPVSEVSTGYIRRLVTAAASEHLGNKVISAVVTVPTNFTDKQKAALVAAANAADLEVLQLISEPVAAVLAHDARPEAEIKDKIVVAAELGGTRSDVAVVASRGGLGLRGLTT
ncbi:Hsp70 protein-domain-containing protein [Lasiosphaeria miniovina]|uniref:Hsp70 protein-domain-containing protein n=1 Tax=Lasiosphaeria miniovina TaxID=1954250 RepID=A0AA39ZTI9_9PEZI|nr:Hsp70 protein-domain-containing protein [Lasiosphaeria miniovina]KAK0703378.1 Hsp70 protein-domain-containing protein [Lasiosphaeria miniovina]